MTAMSPIGGQSEPSVAEEAARWLCELQDGDPEQHAAFFAWLRRSPRHVEEFLFATAVWKKLERFGHGDPARIERLIAAAQAAERATCNIVPLPVPNEGKELQPTRMPHVWARRLAVAAMIAGAVGIAWIFSTRPPEYTTAAGEHRMVRLSDGSRVELNTRSRIKVQFSERVRDIRLLEGEALFTVAKDPRRPFRVDAGDTVIQAVGTQFNVYLHSGGTKVAVLEGAVQIADGEVPVKLAAGEAAQIKSNGRMVRHKPEDIADAVSWREHRLVFRADTLEDVATEVNRYTTNRLRVEGDARKAQLTAVFDADDPDSLIHFLQRMDGVAVEVRDGETLIRSR